MSLSHVYQPLMIRTILMGGGAATRRQIAAAFLAADVSQLEYYDHIAAGYPTTTLKRHGIITHHRRVYRLSEAFDGLTEWERTALIAVCDHRVADYVAHRQDRIWRHRGQNFDPVPGTQRYAILARAKGRCEACGVSSMERALQVDHIVPRAQGGSNDLANLQALCSTCNAQKLDRDKTDFHAAHADYAYRRPDCAICEVAEPAEHPGNLLARFWREPGGALCIGPRRHVSDYRALTQPEMNAMRALELSVLESAGELTRLRLSIEWSPAQDYVHIGARLETLTESTAGAVPGG